MIVDCHTHIWQSPDQLGSMDLGELSREQRTPRLTPAGRTLYRSIPQGDTQNHWQESASVDRVFVLGFRSKHLSSGVPNSFIADYVKRDPQKIIGFAGIDPTEPDAIDELHACRTELGLRGLTVSPANQNFHPADTRAMQVYAEAEKLGMPIVFHPGGHYTQASRLEYGRPYLLDEVARAFPALPMVVPQLGRPWIEETLCLLGKHDNVFADISGILQHSWQAYTSLVSAYQAGLCDKLLFGSDYPYMTANESIEALYSLNQLVQGTNLPVVPRECLRGIVERDTLGLLSLR